MDPRTQAIQAMEAVQTFARSGPNSLGATADRPAMGFAGLASLVSTVSDPLPVIAAPSRSMVPDRRPARAAPSQARSTRRSFGILLGFALLATVRVLTPVPHAAPTLPTPMFMPQTFTVPNFAPPTFAPPLPQRQPGLPTARPAPSIAPPPPLGLPSSISEVKPPPGTDLALSASQILYCLAQKIRLDVMEPIVDLTSAAQLGGFNGLVDDYNLRCLSYRYRGADMEAARRQVEALRPALATQATTQVAVWR
jgi:hypothetical protein